VGRGGGGFYAKSNLLTNCKILNPVLYIEHDFLLLYPLLVKDTEISQWEEQDFYFLKLTLIDITLLNTAPEFVHGSRQLPFSNGEPPPVSDHLGSTFWVVPYRRIDCICSRPLLTESRPNILWDSFLIAEHGE